MNRWPIAQISDQVYTTHRGKFNTPQCFHIETKNSRKFMGRTDGTDSKQEFFNIWLLIQKKVTLLGM
jgi:hypothetical protein